MPLLIVAWFVLGSLTTAQVASDSTPVWLAITAWLGGIITAVIYARWMYEPLVKNVRWRYVRAVSTFRTYCTARKQLRKSLEDVRLDEDRALKAPAGE